MRVITKNGLPSPSGGSLICACWIKLLTQTNLYSFKFLPVIIRTTAIRIATKIAAMRKVEQKLAATIEASLLTSFNAALKTPIRTEPAASIVTNVLAMKIKLVLATFVITSVLSTIPQKYLRNFIQSSGLKIGCNALFTNRLAKSSTVFWTKNHFLSARSITYGDG